MIFVSHLSIIDFHYQLGYRLSIIAYHQLLLNYLPSNKNTFVIVNRFMIFTTFNAVYNLYLEIH